MLVFTSPCAQSQPAAPKQRDRIDLLTSVHKVQTDHHRIEAIRKHIKESREARNRKALKIHREKLALEKNALKADYAIAKEQESTYFENKNGKIKTLEVELKASGERYESIRKQIKKDLAKRNDFSLQKDAADLLKAVQHRNETSTELAMEKSDLYTTVEALNTAWKNVKLDADDPPSNTRKPPDENNLSTVK